MFSASFLCSRVQKRREFKETTYCLVVPMPGCLINAIKYTHTHIHTIEINIYIYK